MRDESVGAFQFSFNFFRIIAMANEIINNLLVRGAIMRGTTFQDLSSKFHDVLRRRKDAKKAIIEKHQSKVMREAYKNWLIQKHKPEEYELDTAIVSWEHCNTI